MTRSFVFKTKWIWWIAGLLAVAIIIISASIWWTSLGELLARLRGQKGAADEHEHHASAPIESVELSDAARKALGLIGDGVGPAKVRRFVERIDIPGIVVHRPGISRRLVPAPMGGIVSRIFVTDGELVAPGQPLFELRLTHEELVDAQGEFLRLLAQVEVVQDEIDRLRKIDTGVLPGSQVLLQEYEKRKLQAATAAMRERLRLHGLSSDDVRQIERTGRLLQTMTVYPEATALGPDDTAEKQPVPEPMWQVERLNVQRGQHVDSGDALCSLADNRELYIEGRAFEQDIAVLHRARDAGGGDITALFESDSETPVEAPSLRILSVSSYVDETTRTVQFFVGLPNVAIERPPVGGRKFVDWRFRPGQRVTLRIAAHEWKEDLVLPVEAVVEDGVESYVFRASGNAFLRRPVHVKHRGRREVVVANDGQIFPGDKIALRSAFLLQLELKNKAGGGVDPHAGHSH